MPPGGLNYGRGGTAAVRAPHVEKDGGQPTTGVCSSPAREERMGDVGGPDHARVSMASGWPHREARCGQIVHSRGAPADVRYFFVEACVAWALAACAV